MAVIQQHSSELAEISSLEAREASLRGRSAEVASARKKLGEELVTKKAAVEAVQKELRAVRGEVEENASLHANLTESVQDAQQCIASARDELNGLESTITTAEKEWTLLDRMHRQYEGYGQGVRTLLTNGADVDGLRGVLADGITIDKAYETVIAAYLDDMLQYVVAGRTEDAEAGMAYLREQEAGRASFLLLDRMKSRPAPADLPFEDDGIIGRASTMVKSDKALDPAVTHLLSRDRAREGRGNGPAAVPVIRHRPGLETADRRRRGRGPGRRDHWRFVRTVRGGRVGPPAPRGADRGDRRGTGGRPCTAG